MASFHVTSLISVCHLRLSFSEEIQYGIQGLAKLPGGFFRCLSASSSRLHQKAELEGCVRLGGAPWGWVMRRGTEGRTDGTCKYSGILAKWDSDAAPLVLGVCACTRVHMWLCVWRDHLVQERIIQIRRPLEIFSTIYLLHYSSLLATILFFMLMTSCLDLDVSNWSHLLCGVQQGSRACLNPITLPPGCGQLYLLTRPEGKVQGVCQGQQLSFTKLAFPLYSLQQLLNSVAKGESVSGRRMQPVTSLLLRQN